MDFSGKTVLVVGAGLSGMATCHFLLSQSVTTLLVDNKSREALCADQAVVDFINAGGRLISGIPESVTWDLAVVSPGVPLGIPILNMTRKAGVPVIGEVELAFRLARAPFLGVTGTNGKTTTTALIGHILEAAGVEVLVGGNIGKPLVDSVSEFHGQYIVAELSSFQLESCITFRPQVAAYLNLTPDHLDRHGDMAGYGAAKEKLFANQKNTDIAVLNWDDERVRALGSRIAPRIFWFSLYVRPANGIYLDEGRLRYIVAGEEKFSFATADIFIKGRHNLQNAMAAFLVAAAVRVEPGVISRAIINFPGVEHRLEYVTERAGVLFVNDSKGTNPASTYQAILAYDRPMVLLLGGRNKGSDFTDLMALVKERVKAAVLYGEAAGELKMAADMVGYENYLIAHDFSDAVAQAQKMAAPGDVVMLSPACASWDSFANFEERGRKFKKLVG